jgi:hypothetical protein
LSFTFLNHFYCFFYFFFLHKLESALIVSLDEVELVGDIDLFQEFSASSFKFSKLGLIILTFFPLDLSIKSDIFNSVSFVFSLTILSKLALASLVGGVGSSPPPKDLIHSIKDIPEALISGK